MAKLKTNVTVDSLCFSWVSGPVEDRCDLGPWKVFCFSGLVPQLKINVTLESWCFSWVIVPVEDQCHLGKLVFFMGYCASGRSMSPWKVCVFHGLVSQLKINVTLESSWFSWVGVQVEDPCYLGMFVLFMG